MYSMLRFSINLFRLSKYSYYWGSTLWQGIRVLDLVLEYGITIHNIYNTHKMMRHISSQNLKKIILRKDKYLCLFDGLSFVRIVKLPCRYSLIKMPKIKINLVKDVLRSCVNQWVNYVATFWLFSRKIVFHLKTGMQHWIRNATLRRSFLSKQNCSK